MALVYFDDDPWITAHDACEKLCRDIQSQLVMWSGESRMSALFNSLSAEIRLRLKQYNSEITQLKQQLDKTIREQMITDAESERRSRQIEILQSKYLQLQGQFNNGIQASASRSHEVMLDSTKQELFGYKNRDSTAKHVTSANWGTGSDDEEMLDGSNSLEQIKKKNDERIQEQNRGLDELSKIIARQKQIATTVESEVTFQNDLIDELADQVDRTDGHIQSETGLIRQVDMKDSTCRYWTIIIILLVANILVGIFL